MINLLNKNFYFVLAAIFLSSFLNVFAQGSDNNCFLFNGTNSRLYVLDEQPVNSSADQNGFAYFNKVGSTNNTITVQAWIYLIGDNTGVKMPVIYRSVNPVGTSFSLYVQNNKGYFTVGNSAAVSTSQFPAFQWIQLTGIYDGTNLKIYLNKDLAQSVSFTLSNPYSAGVGLFVGKSDEGAFKGLIDEIRIFNTPLGDNNINGSGGNGNPAENFPSSLSQYSVGQWSFTGITNNTYLADLSTYSNHLYVENINQIYSSKNLPFFVVTSTADDPDATIGDGSAVSLNGNVTLRSAIQEANVLNGEQIVYFYIPGNPPYIIQPGSALPNISDPVFLDGTTQHNYVGSPLVQTAGAFGGLTITGGNTILNGLNLNSSSGYGLTLSSGGGNIISANQIGGLLINSSANTGNNNNITNSIADGVNISSGNSNNQITNNTITGNTGNGVSLSGTSGNSVTNNVISSNSLNGISVSNSADYITGNTFTGNTGVGISIASNAGNLITNNNVESNTGGGILITNSTETLSGNTVTGNSGFGVSLSTSDFSLSNNEISGNSSDGVIINGNGNSISDNTIHGNGADGLGAGVYVESGNHNSILNNSIYDNSVLGIKLNASANDSQQFPTLSLMYTWQDSTALPQIKGGTAIQGTLNSTTPHTNYKIQFFANTSSVNREGKRFLGEIETTTDISGEADFVANMKDVVLNEGEVVSATATSLYDSSNALSTSEFSPSIERSTDEGNHYIVNTTLAGIPLHWKDGESYYNIAPSVSDLGYAGAVQNGFGTWRPASPIE